MSENGSTKPMSKTERTTLIRLVKQRFKLLEAGLSARRHQIEAALREEVRLEREADIAAFKARYQDEVIEPARALQGVVARWQREAQAAGLEYGQTGWTRSLGDVRIDHLRLEPADLQAEVQRRLQALTGGRPMTRYALELEESRLVEELLVGDLDSDGAKAFLDRVPDVDRLLPLANSAAAIAIEVAEEA